MKKYITITSLFIRFYVRDGWSEETLRKYISPSAVLVHFSEPQIESYWSGDFLKFDFEAMYENEEIGKLLGMEFWPELSGMTDLEVLKSRTGQ